VLAVFTIVNVQTKIEVDSITLYQGRTGVQDLKCGTWLQTPPLGWFATTCHIYLCTKFETSICTHSRQNKGKPKFTKQGNLLQLGSPVSLKMLPFDRPSTTPNISL